MLVPQQENPVAYTTDPHRFSADTLGRAQETDSPIAVARHYKADPPGEMPSRALEDIERRVNAAAFELRAVERRLSGSADRIHGNGGMAGEKIGEHGEPIVQGSLPAILSALDGLRERVQGLHRVAERFEVV